MSELIRRLRAAHPDAHCALDHENPFQLLVATILSAQCTDERVNQVTPALFARFPTPEAMAAADRAELEELIRTTGFFRNKAKSLQGASALICQNFGGEVPQEMDELISLPGVARKTANVVRGVCFGLADGIVVDTHVKRLSQRLGLTQEKSPEKIEKELMTLIPAEDWIDIAHLLIFHGRRVCNARKPDCANCSLADLCPSAGEF
ncbi:MAG: endonuclease III [Caldilineaceae bacterium]|nr:endonuclease III [Caldilineaceae bacterium]MDE0182735.1 endonuclease III [Caldilineaceae bacterium]